MWRNIVERTKVVETRTLCSITVFFFENRAVYGIMWRIVVERTKVVETRFFFENRAVYGIMWRNIVERTKVVETRVLCSITVFFFENRTVYGMMWRNIVERTKVVKTRTLCSIIFFRKSRRLWDNVEKYCRADKSCRNTHFMLNNCFFFENRAVYGIMWRNIVEGTKVVETRVLCSITVFSRKSRRLWDNVEKYRRADKSCRNTNFMLNNCFFFENRAVYEIMWRNIVERTKVVETRTLCSITVFF